MFMMYITFATFDLLSLSQTKISESFFIVQPCNIIHIPLIYRVAQNKIPHQTICNIFATSGQILKILEAV